MKFPAKAIGGKGFLNAYPKDSDDRVKINHFLFSLLEKPKTAGFLLSDRLLGAFFNFLESEGNFVDTMPQASFIDEVEHAQYKKDRRTWEVF